MRHKMDGGARRLRVGVVCGVLPMDFRHLETAARRIELPVYRSRWLPPGVATSNGAPRNVIVRDFVPLVRSNRDRLAFAYRGLRRALNDDRPDVCTSCQSRGGCYPCRRRHGAGRIPVRAWSFTGCDTKWHHGSFAEQWVGQLVNLWRAVASYQPVNLDRRPST